MTRLNGFVDAGTLPGGVRLRPDVCIVGSGAGGAVTAAVLARAGLEVLVLEEGGHHTRRDFRMREDTAFPTLYQDDGARATEDLAISILQGRSVGGSTTINWTTSFRTPPEVVEHWARVHGARGIPYAELERSWATVEERLGIEAIPLELANPNNRKLHDGCKALGYQVDMLRRNVRGCVQSGFCGMGCPIDAKQSMLVSYLPDAVKDGAAVLSRCRADRIEFEGKRPVRVHATRLSADGVTPLASDLVVEPRRLILSGGGINTPAMLLRSGVSMDGRVGRRTFLHPTVGLTARHPEKIEGYYGAPQSVASHHFAHRKDGIGFVLETAPIHPMMASLATPGFGREYAEMLSHLPYATGHIALLVDGFHPDEPGGTVKLRASGAPVLSYPLPKRLLDGARDALKVLAKINLAAGAIEVISPHDPPVVIRSPAEVDALDRAPYEPNRLGLFSAHVMGGCMMSDDPNHGIVRSEDFAVHGYEDLHIIDGSVFPTSLGVNPQLSIYGLAHAVAGRLATKWAGT